MSVASIFSSPLMNYASQAVHSRQQQFQQEFQQLGQDLQSGNLSAAQTDLSALQQLQPQTTSSSGTQSNNAIAQEFTHLAQDLKSGDTAAAQKDYAQIQQDLQSSAVHNHHHRHHAEASSRSNQIAELFQQLGQQLQSGSLSGAQQTYSALSQDLQLPSWTSGSAASPSAASISLTA